ncbi:MAG TPA: hypothetical protein VGD61_24840 [Pyrinomonadaceae bacterium]
MKPVILLTLLLIPFLLMTQQIEPPEKRPANQFKLIVPKSSWEQIFFEEINKRARIAKLQGIRVALPNDDLELRLWNGFGLTALEGFVLRRHAGEWSAIHLEGIRPRLPKLEYQKQLSAPKSGWNEAWRKLVEMGVATLPDAEEISCSGGALDGMSYVVELNYERTYRTYLYDNPSYAKCQQAKRMIAIGNFIADEFGVREMATN